MTDLITKARALLAAVTPGPWERSGESGVYAPIGDSGGGSCEITDRVWGADGDPEQPGANARLIAAAPTLLAALADEVERLDYGRRVAVAALVKAEAERDEARAERDRLRAGLRSMLTLYGGECADCDALGDDPLEHSSRCRVRLALDAATGEEASDGE